MPMSRASLFSQLLLLSLSPDENIWENCELIAFLSVEKQFKSPCYHQDNIFSEHADYLQEKINVST